MHTNNDTIAGMTPKVINIKIKRSKVKNPMKQASDVSCVFLKLPLTFRVLFLRFEPFSVT